MADKQAPALKRFGRYLLLDHVVDGGMASIWRARYLGEQADKVVAVKMVQPHFSKDPAFKTMFMNEIKVTFNLIHPNIAQTYEYGFYNEQLYTAIEYVDGKNLKQYMDKLREKSYVFPIQVSTYIIAQVCQGLHYAHTFVDKLSAQSLNLVHRDISPHNIMLSYDGAVKIIDFGIAKGANTQDATQAGTLKGKLSYLAPEYLDGQALDGRYDQFAVGITLWELLCNRKLFKANNDLAVLKMIQECRIPPPSSINPNVPKELDEIVLKALSKNRDQRFETMDKLNRALVKFLYSTYPDFNATDLVYFSNQLFEEDIQRDRQKMIEFGKIDLTPFLEEMRKDGIKSGTFEDTGVPIAPTVQPAASGRKDAHVLDFGFDKDKTKSAIKIDKKKISEVASGSSDVSSTDVKASTNLKAKIPEPDWSTSGTTTKKNLKYGKTGKIKKDGQEEGSQSSMLSILVLLLVLAGAGYWYWSNQQAEEAQVAQQAELSAKEAEDAADDSPFGAPKGFSLQLGKYVNHQHRVYLNGELINVSVLGVVTLPGPGDYVLRVQATDRKHFIYKFKVGGSITAVKVEIPEMPYRAYGYLITSNACFNGKLHAKIFEEDIVAALPISQANGIMFPLELDAENRPIPTLINVTYKKTGDDIERKLSFTIQKPYDKIDFCSLINAR